MANNDPTYIPFSDTTLRIHQSAMIALEALYEAGRMDLNAPYTQILALLGTLDRDALAEIDARHDVVRKKVG